MYCFGSSMFILQKIADLKCVGKRFLKNLSLITRYNQKEIADILLQLILKLSLFTTED